MVIAVHILTKIKNELQDLETRNPFLPPNADTTSTLEIVPVHQNMNEKVQANHNPLDGCRTNELGVAKQCCSAMMVRVEESQWLLFEKEKDRVDQFKVFGQVIELHARMH